MFLKLSPPCTVSSHGLKYCHLIVRFYSLSLHFVVLPSYYLGYTFPFEFLYKIENWPVSNPGGIKIKDKGRKGRKGKGREKREGKGVSVTLEILSLQR